MNIMLLSYDTEELLLFKEKFSSFKNIKRIDCIENGNEAIKYFNTYTYDIVFFELFLPEKDGIDILNIINIMKFIRKPIFIALSSTKNTTVLNECINLGVDYIFFKPYNINTVLNRVTMMVSGNDYIDDKSRESIKMNKENYIRDILNKFDFKTSVLGYKYLLEAVTLCLNDSDLLKNLTKGVYIEIAIKHKTTVGNVERAIRHLIKTQYERNSVPFKDINGGDIQRPSNHQFITYIVDIINGNLVFKYNYSY